MGLCVDEPADQFRVPFDILDTRSVRMAGVEEPPRRPVGRGSGDGGVGRLQSRLERVEIIDNDGGGGVTVLRAFLGPAMTRKSPIAPSPTVWNVIRRWGCSPVSCSSSGSARSRSSAHRRA